MDNYDVMNFVGVNVGCYSWSLNFYVKFGRYVFIFEFRFELEV